MLQWIRIKDVAIIDELEVDFAPGLNLLTGETGAGKSILIDALGLILGWRASSELIRTGAGKAIVEAGFEVLKPPSEFLERLSSVDIEFRGELVVRREVSPGGRGKVIVNGNAVSSSFLREISSSLANVHGQGQQYALVQPNATLQVVDGFGSLDEEVKTVSKQLSVLRSMEAEIASLEHTALQSEKQREQLSFELTEIDNLDVQTGEDDRLEEERDILANAEKLGTLAEGAYQSLYDGDGAVLSELGNLWKQVEDLSRIDSRVAPYLEGKASVQNTLDDLALFLRDYRGSIGVSSSRLDEVQTRLVLIDRLKKKYGGNLESVILHQEHCRQQLAIANNVAEQIESINQMLEQQIARYLTLAKALSVRRHKAAKQLQRRVTKEFQGLALENATFHIEIQSLSNELSTGDWSHTGIDKISFLFSANPGEEARELSRVASGGELSRFMLALKSVVARIDYGKTLVFDEVDAGIGGRVANAVGEKLKDLASAHQVICVTHLPQIACFAPAHYCIKKVHSGGRTYTGITRLEPEQRIDEIARMLAGDSVTTSARQHAEELLAGKSPLN